MKGACEDDMGYITCCPECRDKLDKLYYMIPVEGTERGGVCRLCVPERYGRVEQYEFSRRRPYYSRKGSGGGERKRAGER